jgi:hypothetical protein
MTAGSYLLFVLRGPKRGSVRNLQTGKLLAQLNFLEWTLYARCTGVVSRRPNWDNIATVPGGQGGVSGDLKCGEYR